MTTMALIPRRQWYHGGRILLEDATVGGGMLYGGDGSECYIYGRDG